MSTNSTAFVTVLKSPIAYIILPIERIKLTALVTDCFKTVATAVETGLLYPPKIP